MNCDRKNLLLYAVTDRSWLNGRTLASQVGEALRGGVTFVQLREKGVAEEELLADAMEVKALCSRYGVPFVINDNVELACKIGADGVHVGQKDMEAGRARKMLGPDKILGVSARTVEQALLAERQGADYLGVGAVFQTGTKSDAQKLDHEVLRAICEAVRIPVIAIGGIEKGNVMELAGSGVCGVAVVSAVFAQPDIARAAAELKMLVKEMTGKSLSEGKEVRP